MGLIKAGVGAVGGVLADQWKEYFYCDALENSVLVKKGQKRISGRSSNTKGEDNIISNGSVIAVADGQCMIIVEQGKVVEVCAEPGEFKYDTGTEPSIFSGSLGKSILDTFKNIGKRFTFGGSAGADQRVYYFNTKEILNNKFGTPSPIPFRVVDSRIGLDVDVSLRCSGVYSFRIANPLLFYTNVCGNVENEYPVESISGQLKTEFISALHPSIGALSALEIRPSALPSHASSICEKVNAELDNSWKELRGLEVVSVSVQTVNLPDEDAEMIKTAQQTAIYRDPTMAAASLVGAQSEAMKSAAKNSAGAMTGFMGMGMVQNSVGTNTQNLFAMGEKKTSEKVANTDEWKCSCGKISSGKFCTECGNKKPETDKVGEWKCACGFVNNGKFCSECGAKKPVYKCDKCGYVPQDPSNPPKFCPECGDRFDSLDAE